MKKKIDFIGYVVTKLQYLQQNSMLRLFVLILFS